MNVLLVEDDRKLGQLIVHMLQKEGYRPDWARRGDEALDLATVRHYDLVILDWMLPELEGIDVCRALRGEGYQGPILMLSARDAVDDRVAGLDAGIDDYLVKPFEFSELFARIRALSRRAYAPLKDSVVEWNGLVLNETDHTLGGNGRSVPLTNREFQLLQLLLQNRGQTVPREVILDRIWGYETDVSSNVIDATVRLLRKKLAEVGAKDAIISIRGVGYKLEP